MRRFPSDLADLLTPRGRRLLEGRDRTLAGYHAHEPGRRFFLFQNLISPTAAAGALALLERALGPVVTRMEQPVAPATTWGMQHNYEERLPKTARVSTALLDSRRARSYALAEEIGLVRMLRSESFGRLGEVLSGRVLRQSWGIQALRYGPGDYAGPHNDHHPEDPEARDGYFDVHLSFSSHGVAHQWLVYEKNGHLGEMAAVGRPSVCTAYRLPFWHYTTPLAARGRRAAFRWVLLGTFLYARARSDRDVRSTKAASRLK